MKSGEREQLKDNLRAMAAGRGEGIDLDTPFHWVAENIKDSISFFEHLPKLLPAGTILYVEGTSISAEVAAFYQKHHAHSAVAVVRDTIFPTPDIYHFTFSPEVAAHLKAFANSCAAPDLFDHIKAYCGESLLFSFHDAFQGWLLFSEHLAETDVAMFCQALGVGYRREPTKRRDPEQLRWFLDMMEHPEKVQKVWVAGEPWWKRLWKKWS
jgi:hypothetical protein